MIHRFLRRLILGKPREIILGKGEVVCGVVHMTDGRIGVLITPAYGRGEVGADMPDIIHSGTRRDTVLWVDGPVGPLIKKLQSANAAMAEEVRP